MNLSLIIIVVMIAAVIPWLTVRFWMSQPKKAKPLLDPSPETPVPNEHKKNKNPNAILDCLSQELDPNEIMGMKRYALAVVAPEEGVFLGYDLLQALTDAGLTYGHGKLFHYYVANEIIFSVAPQAEPYYFDMDDIASYQTHGLHFIFDAYKSGYEDLAREVAVQLADELQGEVRETLR